MVSLTLSNYIRVERRRFIKEKFFASKNSIYLIESGVFEYSVAGETFTAGEFDLIFYREGVFYERTVISPVTLHIFDIDEDIVLPVSPFSITDKSRIISTLRLLSVAESHHQQKLQFIEHLLSDILKIYTFEKEEKQRKVYEQRISLALKLMTDMYDKAISVEDIAKSVHISYPHFIRLFKKELGTSPSHYIANLRLEKAKALLLTTELSVRDIAIECGFDDIFYFSNFFKKKTGLSPVHFKNSFENF